ncbi:MAG: very short patch repair endonuclease [Dehalococcoidia bacterium]|nr:very short patch repair endonuclease [Dehalococcoidia bacterium]
MTDTLSKQERSERMRLVKSKDTRPELVVRRLCRELSHKGYRLHRKDLPGKPDIAFIGRKVALFVHGCFWHGHDCHGRVRHPKSNQYYWRSKIDRNVARDVENIAALETLGWRVIVIWECETKHLEQLAPKLINFLAN